MACLCQDRHKRTEIGVVAPDTQPGEEPSHPVRTIQRGVLPGEHGPCEGLPRAEQVGLNRPG
jgi:hypothetical protein